MSTVIDVVPRDATVDSDDECPIFGPSPPAVSVAEGVSLADKDMQPPVYQDLLPPSRADEPAEDVNNDFMVDEVEMEDGEILDDSGREETTVDKPEVQVAAEEYDDLSPEMFMDVMDSVNNIEMLDRKVLTLAEENMSLQTKLDEVNRSTVKQIEKLSKLISQKSKTISTKQSLLMRRETDLRERDDTIDELKSEVKRLRGQNRDLEGRLKNTVSLQTLRELRLENDGLTTRLNASKDLRAENSTLRAELKNLRGRGAESNNACHKFDCRLNKKKAKRLEEELAAARLIVAQRDESLEAASRKAQESEEANDGVTKAYNELLTLFKTVKGQLNRTSLKCNQAIDSAKTYRQRYHSLKKSLPDQKLLQQTDGAHE